jgi:SAM-dependent methyltransferase
MAPVRRGQASLGKWTALPATVLVSWLVFCLAAASDYGVGSPFGTVLFVILAFVPIVLAKIAFDYRRRWWPAIERKLEEHTDQLDALPKRSLGLWIALAAGVGLYLELVLIRFHGSCFAVFGFFKNLSLLSCFLGLGMGYSLGRVRLVLTPLALPLLAIQLMAMHFLQYAHVAVHLENPISEQLTMGVATASSITHVIMVYGFLFWVFSFNALCLAPFGQLASHLMGRSTRLAAYGWNLFGSIAAVLAFWGLSFLWSPPVVWFAVGFVFIALFLRKMLTATAIIMALTLGAIGTSFQIDGFNLYSPYQILTVYPAGFSSRITPTAIMVNHFFYQDMYNLSPNGPPMGGVRDLAARYYGLPYDFQKSPQDVLVVGAGSGNDVASALRHNAGHVDAVEIDPLILRLGQTFHPERPYASDRVTPHVQDARAYFRSTDKKFDLIVYGLLDSHTALSGMSGVRLDSYIYTVEAFRQARACLKDGGFLFLSFAVNDKTLGNKLFRMLEEAFDGQQPRVMSATAAAEVSALVFVIGGNSPLDAIPLPPGVEDITSSFTEQPLSVDPSTDDWPFFYMPVRKYPVSYLVMISLLMAVAVAFIRPVIQTNAVRAAVSWPCFLLGAGFMLLETKAITELALFYGSTWIVISIVILAILIMAFLANLTIMRWPGIPRNLSYILLLVSLVASLWFSTVSGSIQGQWLSRILPTVILTLPLFFSGLVFSAEMDAAASVSAALGSNLIGAMAGGCLEYNSMYFGYRSLYILAIVVYGLSLIAHLASGQKNRLQVVRVIAEA